MAAVIDFSRRNFREGTGGPFAAGVFERDSGRLVVIGVNRVVALELLLSPRRDHGPVAGPTHPGDI